MSRTNDGLKLSLVVKSFIVINQFQCTKKILVLYIKNSRTMDWKTIKVFGMCITLLKKNLGLATFGIR